MDEIEALFEKHESEFLEFSRVENKRSNRPDLHAFLLLDSIVSGTTDIIDAAEHDEIYFSVTPEDLTAACITEDQVIELRRCGVRISEGSLSMFV